MEQHSGKWSEALDKIVSIIRRTTLIPLKKWGVDVYTHNGKNVLSYGGFKDFCSIWFYNGVFLKDELNVLVNASEGKTKSLRQWRFSSIDEINERQILAYIREAITIEEQGLKLPRKHDSEVEMPELLRAHLTKDSAFLSAFESLTKGRQKEYAQHIAAAKQDTTKLKRIEQIKPMILSGVGLNDKYKK
jgi:uncharacterized protein YdeI (YjbR/CyaY-like superfamily)